MIQVSQEFLDTMELRTDFKQYATATLADGTVFNWTPEDFTVTNNYISDGANESVLPLGIAVEKVIQIEVLNPNEYYNQYSFYGATIELELRYQLSQSVETLARGTYTVVEPAEFGDTLIITAVDEMHKADVKFNGTITFPITLGTLLSTICTAVGITLGTTTFHNSDYSMSGFYGDLTLYTCRQIIGFIAQLACGNARINYADELEILTYSGTSLATLSNWVPGSLTIGTDDVTVTGIKTTLTIEQLEGSTTDAEVDYISGTDDYVLKITNPFFTVSNVSVLLASIASVLVGFTVRPFSGECVSNPLLEFMDTVTIVNKYNRNYLTVLTDIEYNVLGTTSLMNSAEPKILNNASFESTASSIYIKAVESSERQVQNVSNYFWHDLAGAHVSTVPDDATIGPNVLVDNNSLDIRDGQTVRASFGENTQIGETGNSHLEMDYHSLQLKDREGNTYFHVSDLRDEQGVVMRNQKFTGDGITKDFYVQFNVLWDDIVTIDNQTVLSSDYTILNKCYTFTNAPADGSVIDISYYTSDSSVKAYTFGIRASGGNINIGASSVVEGYNNVASGAFSHAEGQNTEASGFCSHAEGYDTEASLNQSHAEGYSTTASGSYSHAEGHSTTASGTKSHAEGELAKASGQDSHAEGYNTKASASSTHAEGISTVASASASHAEGQETKASGAYSHAEGFNTTASGQSAHAEGYFAKAEGKAAHAEGYSTANGDYSHAEGDSYARGDYSHAGGCSTVASRDYQTVIGKYNYEDSNFRSADAAFIIGGGTSDDVNDRKDIFDVNWDGKIIKSPDAWHNFIQIPANADLDDYYTFGKYVVASNNDAATLTNSPSTTAGILLVIPQGWGAYNEQLIGKGYTWAYTQQIYFNMSGGGIFSRYGSTGSGSTTITWNSWTSMGTTNSVTNAGLVPAPTSSKPYYMYATDASGNPAWTYQDSVLSRLPYYTMDGSGFNKNFKLISTTDRYSNYHKRSMFSFDSSTKSTFSNIPTVLNLEAGAVVGIREVYWRSSIHILVKVTEMYPNYGREHYCFCNNGTWSAWYCKGAGYLMSELVSSGAADYSRIIVVPMYSYASLGLESSTTDANFFKAWLKKICEMYPNRSTYTFVANASPNSRRMVVCFIYDTSRLNSEGLPEAAFGTVIPYHSDILFDKFGTSSYSWYFNTQRTHTASWGMTLGTDGSSVANNTTVDKGSFSLDVGLYIVGLTCSWQANSAGRRVMAFGTSSSSYGYINQVIDAPGSNGSCAQMLTTVINVTDSTTKYHLYLIQNSGSALTATCRYGYIRIA